MNAVLFAIFFSFLVGEEKKINDNPVVPVVVAMGNETKTVINSNPAVEMGLDWNERVFSMDGEWTKYKVKFHSLFAGIGYQVFLDPETPISVSYTNQYIKQERLIHSGESLEQHFPESVEMNIRLKGAPGQRVIFKLNTYGVLKFDLSKVKKGECSLVAKIDIAEPRYINRAESLPGMPGVTRYFTVSDTVEIPAGYDYTIYENDDRGKPMKNRQKVCGGLIERVWGEEDSLQPGGILQKLGETGVISSFAQKRKFIRILGVDLIGKGEKCNQSFTITIRRNTKLDRVETPTSVPATTPPSVAKKE